MRYRRKSTELSLLIYHWLSQLRNRIRFHIFQIAKLFVSGKADNISFACAGKVTARNFSPTFRYVLTVSLSGANFHT